jgi:hypothetical protein
MQHADRDTEGDHQQDHTENGINNPMKYIEQIDFF